MVQLAGQIRCNVKKLPIEIGIDLKNVPPIPMAVPSVGLSAFLLLGSVVSSLLWYRDLFPGQASHAAISVCDLGYLLALAALWSVMVFGCIAFLFLAAAMIRDTLVMRYSTQRRRRPLVNEALCLAVFFLLVIAVMVVCPRWVPLAATLLLICGSGRHHADAAATTIDAAVACWIETRCS